MSGPCEPGAPVTRPIARPPQVVWFKRDLRVQDHRPLAIAAERGPVIPLYVIEPDAGGDSPAALDAHGMDPVRVLRLARSMGGVPARTLVVGCEPLTRAPGMTRGRSWASS